MKRRLIISFIIIVLLVAYGLLGIDYRKQRQEQGTLAASIADVTRKVQQIPVPPQNLEQRLTAAQASLSAAQSAFLGKPNSTQVINKILRLAEECQVKAIPLATQQWLSDTAIKGYLVFRLQLTIQGDFPQFVNFVSKLESGEFDTLAIENLSVTAVINKTEENVLPDMTPPIKANLAVAIYAKSVSFD